MGLVVKYGRGLLLAPPLIKMGIFSVYIISKAGGLIFSHDMNYSQGEGEIEFSEYPVSGLVLEEVDRNIMLKFGEVQYSDATRPPAVQGIVLNECTVILFAGVRHLPD